jgi:hypothetical protein
MSLQRAESQAHEQMRKRCLSDEAGVCGSAAGNPQKKDTHTDMPIAIPARPCTRAGDDVGS